MLTIVIILGIAAVAANVFLIWYVKRAGKSVREVKPSPVEASPRTDSNDLFNSDAVRRLKEAVAAELNISVEELNRMPVEKISRLAKEMELI